METWIQATAVSVKDKEVKRKSDGRSFTIYTIESDHGEFTTSRREMAEEVFRYLNVPARYLIDVQQNGSFTNNYLQDIAPADEAPSVVQQAQESTPAPAAVVESAKVAGGPGWTEKDLAIFRQTAAKVAARTSRTPDEFWANIDEVYRFFVDGTKP